MLSMSLGERSGQYGRVFQLRCCWYATWACGYDLSNVSIEIDYQWLIST